MRDRPGLLLLVGATLAVVSVGVGLVLGSGSPLVACLLLGGYLGIVVSGVMVPRLAMFGTVVSCVRGASAVALTFDDGPHPVHTLSVVDALAEAGAHATFFVIGERAVAHPEVLRALRRAGHEIGVHGGRSDRLLPFRGFEAARDDLRFAIDAVKSATGITPTLYRPPYGVTTPPIVRAAQELGLTVVGWSVRGLDGTRVMSAEGLVHRILGRVTPGAIVCLHDAPERGERVPAVTLALPRILAGLRERDLSAVTVSALREFVEPSPTIGV